mgnify:CR=1 FL=1
MVILLTTSSGRIWQGLERGRAQEGAGFLAWYLLCVISINSYEPKCALFNTITSGTFASFCFV